MLTCNMCSIDCNCVSNNTYKNNVCMKASAPKKIYLEREYPDNGVLPNGLNYIPKPTDIEYIRTDAFIEKAVEFLKGWDAYRVCLEGHKDWFIEQFKEAMKL